MVQQYRCRLYTAHTPLLCNVTMPTTLQPCGGGAAIQLTSNPIYKLDQIYILTSNQSTSILDIYTHQQSIHIYLICILTSNPLSAGELLVSSMASSPRTFTLFDCDASSTSASYCCRCCSSCMTCFQWDVSSAGSAAVPLSAFHSPSSSQQDLSFMPFCAPAMTPYTACTRPCF